MKFLRSAALAAVVIAGCASTRPSIEQQYTLDQDAQRTLTDMQLANPALSDVLRVAHAYAVFPSIGKAGALIVGGAFGRGVLFENGRAVGYVTMQQGSVGPQLGGETFAELIVLYTDRDTQQLKTGAFQVGADAAAVMLTAGGHVATSATNGVAIYVLPRGGAMAGLSVTGQQLDYSPAG